MSLRDNRTILVTTGTNTSNGTWIACDEFEVPFSLHFVGTAAGDPCEIRVSNNPVQPLDTAHEALFGAAVATDQVTKSITEPYKWIKVRKTAATQGTSVYMLAQSRR